MSLPAQNPLFAEMADDHADYVPKATPVAPLAADRAEPKPARKADGAFRTISEVADELDVPQHVLRFWETKFTQVKPLKRGGGRRYYRPEDVSLLKHIHHLLYTDGYTIKGVQKLLKGQGKNQIAAQAASTDAQLSLGAKIAPEATVAENYTDALMIEDTAPAGYNLSAGQRSALEDMLGELRALRALLPQEAAA